MTERPRTDFKAVESESRLFPQWTGEASTTLPRREEEPQDSSYAAAGSCWESAAVAGGFGLCRDRRTGFRGAQASSAAAGGGMALMMWLGLRRLKSRSLTKVTAWGAVVSVVPLKRPKAVDMGEALCCGNCQLSDRMRGTCRVIDEASSSASSGAKAGGRTAGRSRDRKATYLSD